MSRLRGALVLGATLAIGVTGCTSLLGDFNDNGAPTDGAVTVHPEAGHGSSSSGGSSGSGSSSGGSVSDAAADGPAEATVVILPSVPGKPGTDLTSGGTTSTSASYTFVGAVGESTGSNVVSTSTNYSLHGGVIVGTQ